MKYFLYIILIFNIVSCDIFETREAQSPDQSGSNFQPAIQPEIVIQNLMNAFKDKDVVNYRNCFVAANAGKNFIFIPSSASSLRFPGIWEDWNLDSEIRYFNGVKSSVPLEQPITLVLSTNLESFSFTGDSLRYFSNYSVSLPQADGSIAYFEGNLEFRMINFNNWMIYYWKDNGIEDRPSWSDLKGSNN